MRLSELSPEHTPGAVLEYYRASQDALVLYQSDALATHEATRAGCGPGPVLPARLERFAGDTEEQIRAVFRDLRSELEREVVMALVAAFEAIIRLDYLYTGRRLRRVGRPVDPVFRDLYKEKKSEVQLDDLLDAWKKAVLGHADRIGTLAQLIRHRHWLAHGRYWTDKSGIDPTSDQAWVIASEVSIKVTGFPSLVA